MLKIGDKLICKTKGQPETEFCVRGEVKNVEGDIVTISRALKFGTLPMHNDLTLPESELLKYYTPLEAHMTDDCPKTGAIYEVTDRSHRRCVRESRFCCCGYGACRPSHNRSCQLVR